MSRRTLGILFALLALSAATAWAQSQIRIVRLSYTDGDVQLDRNDGQGFTRAFLNLPIIEGARLSAGVASHAEVEFEDGTARLTPGSVVSFQELRRNGDGTQTMVTVEQGEVYFNLKHRREDEFRVRAGDESFVARKNSHFRLSLTSAGAELAVFNGQLEVLRPNGQQLDVRKHEFLMLDFSDTARYFLSRDITSDFQDDWDRQRESELDAQLTNYNSLNRYGSYLTVANYGSLWRPYGVGFDWDPYQYGNWVWYPGAGYVFVSSTPWGWAPYRYGSWIFVPSVGWCWQGGRYNSYGYNSYNGYAWNPAPVVINPPTGFVRPVPPPQNNGIIIVNRRPHDSDRDLDWRKHPGSRGVVVDSDLKPVSNPIVAPATTNANISTRPERTRRDAQETGDSMSQGRPAAGVRTTSSVNSSVVVTQPVVAPAPVVAPHAAPVATPRPSHVDRTPVGPSSSEPRGRTYVPAQQPAPAPQYTPPARPAMSAPQYTPPPAPAPRPAAGSRDPK